MTEKLKDDKTFEKHQRKIAEELAKLNNGEGDDMEKEWKNMKNAAIIKAADQIIGKKQYKHNQDLIRNVKMQ